MVGLWKATRIARWLLVPIYVAYIIEFLIHKPAYLDWRGLLALSTEMVMFGVPVLFVVLGLVEIMFREKGGIPKPRNFGFSPIPQSAPPTHDR